MILLTSSRGILASSCSRPRSHGAASSRGMLQNLAFSLIPAGQHSAAAKLPMQMRCYFFGTNAMGAPLEAILEERKFDTPPCFQLNQAHDTHERVVPRIVHGAVIPGIAKCEVMTIGHSLSVAYAPLFQALHLSKICLCLRGEDLPSGRLSVFE